VARCGDSAARVITDGPDGDLEIARNVLLGAIASARESLRIVTPYFLPEAPTVAALGVAAMRGDHAKLFVVDRAWALFGSTNWDPRSLRLNFELDVECHDDRLAASFDDLIAARIAESRPFTLADADARPFPVRVRDGIARLFSPYL
jgi:cardiolipin synthase